jgi:predicted Zn-dependent protease
MKRAIALAASVLCIMPVLAQFDVGRLIDYGRKAVDAGSKLKDANREFSQDDEIQLGDGIAATLLGASPLAKDASLQRYVNRVGRWVALHSDRPDLPWTFGVIETQTVNAFAMPGGTILVSRGLVNQLGSESELAGALAHEIAHVVKRHQLAAIQSSTNSEVWSSIGKDVASEAISRRGGDAFGLKSKAAGLGIDAVKNGVFLRPLDRSIY